MYLTGEEMSIVDSNANYVSDAFQARFFVVQESLFQRHLRICRVVCRISKSGKEGTLQHRTENPEAL